MNTQRDRIRPLLHWLATAALLAAGLWKAAQETYLLVVLLLVLPLLDRAWQPPGLAGRGRTQLPVMAALVLVAAGLLVWKPAHLNFAVGTLITAALPEEWFFRAYLMPRIGAGWGANLLASLLFCLLHAITRGPVVAVQVFLPSLFFGWCYQRTGNLVLVVLVHGIANLVFVMFLVRWF